MTATKMSNNDEAGSVNGGRRGRGRGIGADEPPTPVLWPCSLIVSVAYQVAAFNLLVPPDCRLPGGRKISAGVRAIPPLLVGADLENTINSHRNELSEEDRNNPNFAAASDLWPTLLTKERLGPVRPALYNRAGRHAWWNGRSFWELTAALRACLLVPAPRDFTAPRVSSASTRAASMSTSRSVTLRRPSSVGVNFRALATEVK
jgi:hypothetical protein